MPLYVLGFMGMTRRLQSTVNPAYEPLLLIAAAVPSSLAPASCARSSRWPCRSATARRPPT
jgi:heme/copper-type cytochrome/quinol oxidase subunit 1